MKDHAHGPGLGAERRHIEGAVQLFVMLADVTRVLLIMALRDGEQSVNRLAELVEKPQAAVSQHLAKLRLAHLVTTRQVGTKVFYNLANEHTVRVVSDALFHAEHALDDAPPHHQSPESGRSA